MRADVWTEGAQARTAGRRVSDNPYERGTPDFESWYRGFNCDAYQRK